MDERLETGLEAIKYIEEDIGSGLQDLDLKDLFSYLISPKKMQQTQK